MKPTFQATWAIVLNWQIQPSEKRDPSRHLIECGLGASHLRLSCDLVRGDTAMHGDARRLRTLYESCPIPAHPKLRAAHQMSNERRVLRK